MNTTTTKTSLLKAIDARSLFYLIGPKESSFPEIEDVPDYVQQATIFFMGFIIIETIVLLIKNRGHEFRFNDRIGSVSQGIIMRTVLLATQSLETHAYIWVYNRFHLVSLPWDSAWTWWFCFLGVDLGYYCVHRMAHETNILWAGHQVHHSSEDYNTSTALRQSATHTWTSWMFYLPLALIVPPQLFLAHVQFNFLYQFWIHTELIDKLGPLEWIFNTASHHRVHHGRNRYCIDKNYAGTLIIWDRLFGTFEEESEEVVYGLTTPIESFNPIYIQTGHYQHIWGQLTRSKTWSERFSILFKGPGWSEGKPRLGLIEDIPDVKAPVKKYDPQISFGLSVFMVVHMLVITFSYEVFSARRWHFNFFASGFFIAYVLLHLTAIGSTLDKKNYSAHLHLLTSAIFLLGLHLVGKELYETYPITLIIFYALRAYGFCCCLYWLYESLVSPTSEPDKKLTTKPKGKKQETVEQNGKKPKRTNAKQKQLF